MSSGLRLLDQPSTTAVTVLDCRHLRTCAAQGGGGKCPAVEKTTDHAQVIRFATFEVDLQAGELRKSGLKLKFSGQPFQVLAILLEQPGAVITREELQKRLWPDTFVDVDHNLNTAINKIREVLGDSAENPRFVETLPRRGYRFIHPLTTAADSRVASIAVLPFANMSADPENEFVADGITEEITNALAQPSSFREPLVWTLALALLGVTAFGLWGWLRAPKSAARPVMRWATVFPAGYSIENVTLSPDGSHLAYVGRLGHGPADPWQLYVRAMDQFEATPVSGNDPATPRYSQTFFSPDGHWIAYHSQGKLKKVPAAGGASIAICDAPAFVGGAWGPDDTIILGTNIGQVAGLSRVSAAGAKLEPLTTPDPKKGETAHAWPSFLPDGKSILFSIKTAKPWDDARIAVLNLRSGETRVLLEGGSKPRYASSGHLVYTRQGSLLAVPFDGERLQVKGTPSPVLEGLAAAAFAEYSISDSGHLVYRPGGAEEKTTMQWVDRAGKTEPLQAPPRTYATPSISPDGQRVAVTIEAGSPNDWDISVYDFARHTLTKLTYGSFNFAPSWTPDGKRVMFRNESESGQRGIFWVPADGSASPERLFTTELPATPCSWLPDASALVFYQGLPEYTEIGVFALQGHAANTARGPQVVVKNAIFPQFSPDGRWLAYASGGQVYVQPFPSLVGKWQVSTDGGTAPRWARSGRELFYGSNGSKGNKLMAVEIETSGTFRSGVPKVLFEGTIATPGVGKQPGWPYDVSADGKRFLVIGPDSQPNPAAQLNVVENWFEELRRRVPR